MEKDENFVLDPDNIPGVDYYLEALKEPGHGYPKCPNHSEELTIEGFCKAANALAKPFGEAWKKSTELLYGTPLFVKV
jgi:hypothetical protein